MPNHVINLLKISGPEDLVKRIKEEIAHEDRFIDFNMVCPIPEELKGTTSPARILSQEDYDKQEARIAAGELEEHEKSFGVTRGITKEMSDEFIRKYGHNDWYGWQVENWGTKWNAYDIFLHKDGTIKFETAWSTPDRLIAKLSLKYPEAVFNVRFADEDFGHNVGEYAYKNGDLVHRDHPKGGSPRALMMAAEIRDELDYIVTRIEELEEEDMDSSWAKNLILVAYENKLFGDYCEFVWKALQDISVEREEYEMAHKIKEHLDKNS
jgi:hypothetical protein